MVDAERHRSVRGSLLSLRLAQDNTDDQSAFHVMGPQLISLFALQSSLQCDFRMIATQCLISSNRNRMKHHILLQWSPDIFSDLQSIRPFFLPLFIFFLSFFLALFQYYITHTSHNTLSLSHFLKY